MKFLCISTVRFGRWVVFGTVTMVLFVCLLMTPPSPADAIPMFTRKYNLSCERCHTFAPRLTPFGYAFYRAGFRLPSNEVKPLSLSTVASLFADISGNSNPGIGNSDFNFTTVKGLFATSLGKNLAVHAAYTFSWGEERSAFEEAWVQYNSAASGAFWSLRVGQLPVLSGYQLLGGRSFTLADPMLFGANGPQTADGVGNFSLGGNQRGVEVGYSNGGLHTRLSWLNGVNEAGDGDPSWERNRFRDAALQAEYLFGSEGSSLGGFYYVGKTPFAGAGFTNHFQRAGLVGTWGRVLQPGKPGIPDLRLELNGGLVWGRDKISAEGASANSYGTLWEADLYVRHRTAFSARYDTARPSDVPGTPNTEAYTFNLSHRPNDNVRLGLEYRTQRQPNDGAFLGRLRFMY